jgi:trans-2-enoyl-CoA reductase
VEDSLIKFFETQGPWATLFVALLVYVMKTNKDREAAQKEESRLREDRLMAHVEKTTDTLNDIRDSLRDLRSEVDDIKLEIRK